MESMVNEVIGSIKMYLPNLLGALAVLVVGWILAMVIAGIIRGVLKRSGLNNRINRLIGSDQKTETPNVENGIAKGIYSLLMLFVLVAFFQTLRFTLITEPLTRLLNEVFQYLPQFVGALVLLITAWVVAKISQIVVLRICTTANLDERVAKQGGDEETPITLSKSIADAVYGVVFLLFFPAILGALSLDGLLTPVQGMINKSLRFLPNLVTAGVILMIGWFAARLLQQIVTNLLAAVRTDNLSEKTGLAAVLGKQKLSAIIGIILCAFILIPVALAALNTLQLESITQPASNMLTMILAAIPNIFAAAVIIAISYAIGRMVAGLVNNLLAGIGFDSIIIRLGLTKEAPESNWTPSQVAANLVLTIIMFFAILEAFNLLGFAELSNLVSHFMFLAGHIVLGLIIFALGLAIANLVAKVIQTTGNHRADFFSQVSRIAILIFAGAVALRQMGLANEIITLAFGLLMGAVALATAIAFGLGAREIAARELDQWLQTIRSKT